MRAAPFIRCLALASVTVALAACNSGSFAGGSDPAPQERPRSKAPVAPAPQSQRPRDEDSGSTGRKDGQGSQDGSESNAAAATAADPDAPSHGVKVVARGAFAVWAEPETPIPGVPYNVFIQVRLPAGTSGFEKSDLTGKLSGSDGYSQLIGKSLLDNPSGGDYQSEELRGRYGLLTLLVPGGKQGGKDVVKVKSALAHDEQTLTIEY
jgi:hypothetical protein